MKKRFLSITLTLATVLSTLAGTFVTAGAEATTGSTAVTHRKKAVTVLDFEKSKPGKNSSNQPAIDEDGQDYKIEVYTNAKETLSVHSSADEQDETGFPKDAKVIWTFDDYSDISKSPLKGQGGYFSYDNCELDDTADNVYGGSGKSIKFSWLDKQIPRIMNNAEFTKSGDGIIFWLKSETAFNATIAFSEDWDAARKVVVPIAVGENIIKLKYTDFEGYNGGRIAQFRIDPPAQGPAGTIWVDQLCTFTETEGSSFVYGGEGQSLHYHTDEANTGYKGIRFNFSKIPLTDKNGNKWGKDATICIWFNSQRSVPAYFSAQDSEQWHDSAATWWQTEIMTIPKGISVLRIPVSKFNNLDPEKGHGTREDLWDYLGSLNIRFTWAADNSAYDLYIDQIAVEYPTIGDANDDESIDLRDLITIKKKLASATAPEIIKAIDVNGDGLFDGNDLVTFRKYLLGVGSLAAGRCRTAIPTLNP